MYKYYIGTAKFIFLDKTFYLWLDGFFRINFVTYHKTYKCWVLTSNQNHPNENFQISLSNFSSALIHKIILIV